MSLYTQWQERLDNVTGETAAAFQADYYDKETEVYRQLLVEYGTPVKGQVAELAERFDMGLDCFTGFIDGINSSLKNPIELEPLTEESEVEFDFDPEALYTAMLGVKAEWLYGLPEWDNVLSEEKRRELTRDYRISQQAVSQKVDRNAPCPCGSGLKYKKCCGKAS